MHSDKNNITSILLMNLFLILSLFLFTGYNYQVTAAPFSADKTELLLSERVVDTYQVSSFEKSIKSSSEVLSFDFSFFEGAEFQNIDYISTAILKQQSNIFLDIKVHQKHLSNFTLSILCKY